jgi:hypothetical protein
MKFQFNDADVMLRFEKIISNPRTVSIANIFAKKLTALYNGTTITEYVTFIAKRDMQILISTADILT